MKLKFRFKIRKEEGEEKNLSKAKYMKITLLDFLYNFNKRKLYDLSNKKKQEKRKQN